MASKSRVLYVDDDSFLVKIIQNYLQSPDCEVHIAGTGEDGLTAYAEHGPFDLVISDYQMPGINGVDFLRALKSAYQETFCVLTTGCSDLNLHETAVDEGICRLCIYKPFDPRVLKNILNEITAVGMPPAVTAEARHMQSQAN